MLTYRHFFLKIAVVVNANKNNIELVFNEHFSKMKALLERRMGHRVSKWRPRHFYA